MINIFGEEVEPSRWGKETKDAARRTRYILVMLLRDGLGEGRPTPWRRVGKMMKLDHSYARKLYHEIPEHVRRRYAANRPVRSAAGP